MTSRKIAVLVGSLRKESFTRKLAASLADLAPAGLELAIVDIGDLPFYNEDLETEAPPRAWSVYRDHIDGADAVLFCTPEYNRSLPGVLKNAIDVGSRPYRTPSLRDRPCAIISNSPGGLGGFGANHALRQSLVFLNMPCMQSPEVYISNVAGKFEGQRLVDETTRSFLRQFLEKFAEWIERHADPV